MPSLDDASNRLYSICSSSNSIRGKPSILPGIHFFLIIFVPVNHFAHRVVSILIPNNQYLEKKIKHFPNINCPSAARSSGWRFPKRQYFTFFSKRIRADRHLCHDKGDKLVVGSFGSRSVFVEIILYYGMNLQKNQPVLLGNFLL